VAKRTILHVIQRLTNGGASRCMQAMACWSSREGAWEHRFLSLAPAGGGRREAVERADVVVVHFWNTPELYAWLRSDLPSLRLLLVLHVGGLHAPQVVTRPLVDFADYVLATSPFTLRLPVIDQAKTAAMFSPAGFERLAGVRPRPHGAFNVGYIGTLSPVKMHPRFVAMSARVDIPNVRFILCGSMPAAALRNLDGRFEFRGYVEDIAPVLAELDVFGYPLCEDNYSTSDLSLQEAMYAGVPPVIFPYGGIGELVQHGKTGLIVNSEEEYTRAIEYLYHHPEERRRLGEAARDYARQHFGADRAAGPLNRIFEGLLSQPKRERRLTDAPADASGAELFAAALGDSAPQFSRSLRPGDRLQLLEAESLIAASSPVLQDEGGGGIFHYRNAYLRDPMLRLWSGLVLMEQGQNARAFSEFQAALSLGLDDWRVKPYQAQAAARLKRS
jgi:glycosyltransferase involved in cell wall biosynthesis